MSESAMEIITLRGDRLWGATEIAKFSGVSEDTVRRWSLLPDCPISKPSGRYFCTRTALMQWLTNKPAV
jgi:hypothetical protein